MRDRCTSTASLLYCACPVAASLRLLAKPSNALRFSTWMLSRVVMALRIKPSFQLQCQVQGLLCAVEIGYHFEPGWRVITEFRWRGLMFHDGAWTPRSNQQSTPRGRKSQLESLPPPDLKVQLAAGGAMSSTEAALQLFGVRRRVLGFRAGRSRIRATMPPKRYRQSLFG